MIEDSNINSYTRDEYYIRRPHLERLLFRSLISEKSGILQVVGTGGSGKTTLLRLVIKEGKIENYYDETIWLNAYELRECDLKSFIRKKTRSDLSGKKILLIIDNYDYLKEERRIEIHNEMFQLINNQPTTKIVIVTRPIEMNPLVIVDEKIIVGNLRPSEFNDFMSRISSKFSLQNHELIRRMSEASMYSPLMLQMIIKLIKDSLPERDYDKLQNVLDENYEVLERNRKSNRFKANILFGIGLITIFIGLIALIYFLLTPESSTSNFITILSGFFTGVVFLFYKYVNDKYDKIQEYHSSIGKFKIAFETIQKIENKILRDQAIKDLSTKFAD